MLTDQDFAKVADELKCDVNAIKAVNQVETSTRGGFDANGKITVLFEPFAFYKALRAKGYNATNLAFLIKTYPNLVSPIWNPKIYGTYNQQWDKIITAAQIDKEAAYESASYGAFQIMGNNYKSLGFNNVFDFVDYLGQSELNQLEIFGKYIMVNHLDDALIHHDWAAFSSGYNGKNYIKNDYQLHLEQAYNLLQFKAA